MALATYRVEGYEKKNRGGVSAWAEQTTDANGRRSGLAVDLARNFLTTTCCAGLVRVFCLLLQRFAHGEKGGFGRACRSDLGRALRSKLNGFSSLVLHLALGD
jgi:hypothetical protein